LSVASKDLIGVRNVSPTRFEEQLARGLALQLSWSGDTDAHSALDRAPALRPLDLVFPIHRSNMECVRHASLRRATSPDRQSLNQISRDNV
jgi:hypothetical protein